MTCNHDVFFVFFLFNLLYLQNALTFLSVFFVLLSELEVNNGHFLGAMGYDGFFTQEPLASMVF